MINSRLVRTNNGTLDMFSRDNCNMCYACPTHVMRNSIHVNMQKQYVLKTHPAYDNESENAPMYTLIIGANIRNPKNKKAKKLLNKVLR